MHSKTVTIFLSFFDQQFKRKKETDRNKNSKNKMPLKIYNRVRYSSMQMGSLPQKQEHQ